MSESDATTEMPERGSPYGSELVARLCSYATVRNVTAGEKLLYSVEGKAMCYLILEGSVAIHRSGNDTLLYTGHAPALFGIGNVADVFFDEYCKTLTSGKIGVIDVAIAREVIERDNLWRLLCQHLLFSANRLYTHVLNRTAPTAYEVIRIQLMELLNEELSIRHNITAERYIRDKTQLSRSGVMRILADLKTGGFIEMEDGKLVRINKLPAKY